MRNTLIAVSFATMLIAAPLAAQTGVEITPFAGYRWGGELVRGTTDVFDEDVAVKDDSSYGIVATIPIGGSGLGLELLYDRQDTTFELESGLFDPPQSLGDVEITYYHAGLSWEPAWRNDIRPFFAGGLGIGQIRPDFAGAVDESRLSGNFGGGVKVFINKNLGVRLEGRGYWTDIVDNDDYCGYCDYRYDDDLFQGEARIGLMIVF